MGYRRVSRVRAWDVASSTSVYVDGFESAAPSASEPPVGPALQAALEPYRSPEPELREFDYLEITCRSKGYEDPGICSGPPEHCYPPEGDDERTIERIRMYQAETTKVEIPEAVWPLIFPLIETDPVAWKAVEEAELPEGAVEPDFEALAAARWDRMHDRDR